MAVANRLSLNVAETEFMIIGCHQRLLVPNDKQINVQINGKAIRRVSETKPWGLPGQDMSKYFQKHCVQGRRLEPRKCHFLRSGESILRKN